MEKNLTKSNRCRTNSALYIILFCSIAFLAFPNINMAQKAWGIEVRPGVNFATKKLGDANLKTGFGIEGTVNYRIIPNLAAYAGWGWNRFSAGQSFAGTKNDFEETGYTLGLQFTHPFEKGNLGYLLEFGGILNHIEVENNNGDIIADSGHGLGWQAGLGLKIPLGERFSLIPAIRYRALSRDIQIDQTKTAVDLNYVSVGIGLSWAF